MWRCYFSFYFSDFFNSYILCFMYILVPFTFVALLKNLERNSTKLYVEVLWFLDFFPLETFEENPRPSIMSALSNFSHSFIHAHMYIYTNNSGCDSRIPSVTKILLPFEFCYDNYESLVSVTFSTSGKYISELHYSDTITTSCKHN